MPGVNEQQRLEVTGGPGSGNFMLQFNGVWAPTSIKYHPAAGDMKTYLESIPTIGPGNVMVGKESNWVYLIDFVNQLGEQDVPQLVVDYSGLPGGCTVLITTTLEGLSDNAPPANVDQAIVEAGIFLHRLWRRQADLKRDELEGVLRDLQPYIPYTGDPPTPIGPIG